jgi:hypothetical protein
MRLVRTVAPFLVVAALTACTTGPGTDASPSPPPSGSSPVPTISVSAGTTVYVYRNAGLTATLELRGHSGTLEIANETGRELARPAFYLLDARDGHRVDGHVDGAAATADGRTATFPVTFGAIEVRNIGLAVLLIGSDNYGAFVRQ